jgi:hypothetical protein
MSCFDIDADDRSEALHRAFAEGERGDLILLRAGPWPCVFHLVARLQSWSGRRGAPAVHVVELGAGEDPAARLASLGLDPGQRTAVALTGLEQCAASDPGALASAVPGPLLIIVLEEAFAALAQRAPGL